VDEQGAAVGCPAAGLDRSLLPLDGTDIVVSVNLGTDVPGTGPLPGAEDLPAFESRFKWVDVESLVIQAGDGNDRITVSLLSSTVDTVTINSGAGDDWIFVDYLGDLRSPMQIDAGDDDDRIIIGQGDYSFDIFSDIIVAGGSGSDRIAIISTQDQALSSSYTISQSSFRETTSSFGKRVGFGSVEAFVPNAGPNEDVVGSYLVDVLVYGNGGSDTFNIGGNDCRRFAPGVERQSGSRPEHPKLRQSRNSHRG